MDLKLRRWLLLQLIPLLLALLIWNWGGPAMARPEPSDNYESGRGMPGQALNPAPTCPLGTPTLFTTPLFTPGPGCAPAPRPNDLRAVITDHPTTTEARFTNHSNTCAYRIGLATYKKFDRNIDHQELYDWELAVIPPNSSLILEVDNPPCAYQGDAFWGDLIRSFAGGIR